MKPANLVAETIERLRLENESLATTIQSNADLIEQLEPLAEWTEEQEVIPTLEIEPNA
jgi:hypothetical protein